MNTVQIIGNLGQDFELKHFNDGTAHTRNSVAVRRQYKNKNGEYDTDWIPIQATGPRAENLARFFKKGNKIAVEGSWKVDTQETPEGRRTYHNLDVSKFHFIESREQSGSQGYQQQQQMQQQPNNAFANVSDQVEIGDELPF